MLGAGSWGTALALVLSRNGHPTRLWGRDPAVMQAMADTGENHRYLPGQAFDRRLKPVASLRAALTGVDDVVIAVPSAVFGELVARLRNAGMDGLPILIATKGLDHSAGGFLSDVVARSLPRSPAAILSGPSFAGEVARGLPTAVTIASNRIDTANHFADAFHGHGFRPYTLLDPIGVQLSGAVKNVLAVAAGIADGLGLGANTQAGLITRGLAELMRLGEAMGARAQTFMGLSGVGDIVLTCTDDQSRNRRFGLLLGKGSDIAEAVAQIGQTVEAVPTARGVLAMAQSYGLELPICAQVHAILFDQRSPVDALEQLMARQRRDEF